MANRGLVARLVARLHELKEARAELTEEIELIDAMLDNPKTRPLVEELEREMNESGVNAYRTFNDLDAGDVLAVLPFLDSSDKPVWQAIQDILEAINEPLRVETLTKVIHETGRDFGGESPTKALARIIHVRREVRAAGASKWGVSTP